MKKKALKIKNMYIKIKFKGYRNGDPEKFNFKPIQQGGVI